MELRHLRYFVTLAETRSFTRAAERLGISQPTLSHQVKQLEALLGTVLFDRLARSADLTAAGRVFKPFCERILKELDAGVLAVSELEGLMRGTLQMAVFHSFSTSLLGPVLSQFAAQYPGVHVVARLLPRVEMERDLVEGKLDLAVAYASDNNEHIVAEKLFEEELVLVVGSTHPLASRTKVPMHALADLPLVLLTQEFGARQLIGRFFDTTGVTPHIVLEMNAIEPILSTVQNAPLASVLSAGAVGKTAGIRAIRLVDPTPRRFAAILWRREGHRTAAATRMADMIRAAYRDRGTARKKARGSASR